MIYQLFNTIDRFLPFAKASAHCDIPCKVYDPSRAQIAVLTMMRLVDLLKELEQKPELTFSEQATFSRLIAEKEEHGKIVKEEIRIIWGDYIKQPQLDSHPQLHELTHSIMLKTSFAKQHIDRNATAELLELVNKFAQIFWQTKGVETYVATCPYPPAESVVYPDLRG